MLTSTINRYCYVTCRFLPPFFPHKSRIVWSKIETIQNSSQIEHPLIRGCLEHLGIDVGVEIHHQGDLPARSGLGSSSSMAVGTLNALHTLMGRLHTKQELAREAIFVEQELLRENVGVQDQIETAHGGINRIDIARDGGFTVTPVDLSKGRVQQLNENIMMFYTGVSRYATDIAKQKIETIPKRQSELAAMQQMVDEAIKVLVSDAPISDFGKLLHDSWKLKRTLSQNLAPTFVDEIYEAARDAGVSGGKLLGAGGGGFMIFIIEPARRQALLDALAQLLWVPIEFEWSGTSIVYKAEEQYSRTSKTRHDFWTYGFGEGK